MNKIIFVVLAAFVIISVIVTAYMGILPLGIFGEEDYNTGISRDSLNNLETERKKAGCRDQIFGGVSCWQGNIGEDYKELIISPMNNDVIVTAMKSGEGKRSVEVSCYATIAYVGTPMIYWVPTYGWYVVEMTTNGRHWETIIDTKNGQIDESIVSLFSGASNKQSYNKRVVKDWHFPYIQEVREYKTLEPITFRIKDTQVGALRTTQMTEFSAPYGAGLFVEEKKLSVDYAYLASGTGDVEIVDDMTVYEEGETIRFEVDTGFSGQTQGDVYTSKGWQLKIYDSYGDLRTSWTVDDDKRGGRRDSSGKSLDYKIPSDSYRSDGSNTWKVVLTNTLFDQDEELFFTIGLGMREQAPSVPTIDFGDDEYRLGDTVYVTFTSTPNPDGRNTVDGFLINAIYGKDGVDYLPDYQAKYMSAGDNTVTISFNANKGDTYITVEAWAFDAPEGQGGIPSEKETSSVWIKDKEHAPVDLDYTGIIVAILIVIVFGILALIAPVPIPFKIAIFLIGVAVAVLVYAYFFSNLFF